jgi:hypothetical protein
MSQMGQTDALLKYFAGTNLMTTRIALAVATLAVLAPARLAKQEGPPIAERPPTKKENLIIDALSLSSPPQ